MKESEQTMRLSFLFVAHKQKKKEIGGFSYKHIQCHYFPSHYHPLSTNIFIFDHMPLLKSYVSSSQVLNLLQILFAALLPSQSFQLAKLLAFSFMEPTSSPSLNPSPSISFLNVHEQEHSGNFNLIIIVAAIICAVVCAIGLNTMLSCILQCAHHTLRQTVRCVALRGLNTGMKKKDLVAMPTSIYNNSSSPASTSSSSACAICLVDFSNGDKIRVLPNCTHRYHVTCIDQWLTSHSSCPTCRHQLKSKDSIYSTDHIV